jgi:hypothetical protein
MPNSELSEQDDNPTLLQRIMVGLSYPFRRLWGFGKDFGFYLAAGWWLLTTYIGDAFSLIYHDTTPAWTSWIHSFCDGFMGSFMTNISLVSFFSYGLFGGALVFTSGAAILALHLYAQFSRTKATTGRYAVLFKRISLITLASAIGAGIFYLRRRLASRHINRKPEAKATGTIPTLMTQFSTIMGLLATIAHALGYDNELKAVKDLYVLQRTFESGLEVFGVNKTHVETIRKSEAHSGEQKYRTVSVSIASRMVDVYSKWNPVYWYYNLKDGKPMQIHDACPYYVDSRTNMVDLKHICIRG